MSKQEFLEKLRVALSGKVSASLVEENVTYYEEYINTQVRLGRAESVVLSGLGDPRLIAKSIITANNGEIKVENYGYKEPGREHFYEYNKAYDYARARESNYPKIVRIPGWVWLLVAILLIVLICSVIFSLVSFLLPFVPVALVIFFFVKLYKDWLK